MNLNEIVLAEPWPWMPWSTFFSSTTKEKSNTIIKQQPEQRSLWASWNTIKCMSQNVTYVYCRQRSKRANATCAKHIPSFQNNTSSRRTREPGNGELQHQRHGRRSTFATSFRDGRAHCFKSNQPSLSCQTIKCTIGNIVFCNLQFDVVWCKCQNSYIILLYIIRNTWLNLFA